MSNKSGTSEQVISLPKGGGSLKGIGEKFSPDLHTGTGNFTVPIALPPGRNGFQPELSLVYSTGNGNGAFGLGWGLSIPGISRKTSKGVPVYDDSEDVFVLAGAEDLVPVPGGSSGTARYRPRTEGLFARIDHHRDSDGDYWEVRSKDGLVSLYGTPGAAGRDAAVVADPSERTKVFSWKLSQTRDPFGNRIVYAYEHDSLEGGPHRSDQLYLKKIRYADYEDGSGAEQFLVSLTLVYEDELEGRLEERPDPFSDYRAGFEIRTRRRCKRIEIRTHAGEGALARDEGTLVRTYELIYLDERVAAGELPEAALPLNGVSLLSQVRVTGHDETQEAEVDRTQELPPLEFGYTHFEPETRDFVPLQGANLPARSLGSPDTELADLFGNGLPDILEMSGTARYWRNLGEGRYDLPREMRDAPASVQLADPGVQLIDADGDGRTDLLITANGLSGYYPLRFGGLWDKRSFQRFRVAPSFNLEDPEVKLVDLDGDGLTDIVRSGTRFECFFNEVDGRYRGWTPEKTRWVERQPVEEFPNVNFSDSRVKWADMTGDGLQDIVLVHDGNVEYWPNLGHGNWGERVAMRDCPRFPYGYDPKRILLGDVDGDGVADIVYVDDAKVTLWINRSGNGWSRHIEICGTPSVSDLDAVRLADVFGTGIGGVLWSADANGLSRNNTFFLDFTGGTKPYLLSEMDNHMGAVTKVGYAPSTQFYLEDEKRPKTRWKTPLPFPVQVVSRVEAIDEISEGKLTTEYRYRHGYWDGAEREFRGFGMVEQLDTETYDEYNHLGLHGEGVAFAQVADPKSFSPPTLTKTWFHQGPIGDEFGGWEETDFGAEFWRDDDDPQDDPQMLARPSDMTDYLNKLPRRAKRDALRALRGRVLRTELYALDGAEGPDGQNLEERPYTVTEHLHGVREESAPGLGEEDRLRIFFPHELAQRTTQWERGYDPMTRFSFTDKEDYDEYGQPQKQTQIACPRGWRGPEDIPGNKYLATRTKTVYARPVDPQRAYIVDRVAKTTTYEIKNDGIQRLLNLKNTPDGADSLEIIDQTLNFYDGDPNAPEGGAFVGLSLGQVGDYGALARSETLVLTEGLLKAAYKSGKDVSDPPERPPYLAPGDPKPWTDEYPQEFREKLPDLAGYSFRPDGEESEPGYFAATERRRYDFHENPDGAVHGLVTARRDALGNDTTIAYDEPYRLLPVEVAPPKESPEGVELRTRASYDYRVLQPREVTDPNLNLIRYAYEPLGLLKEIWVSGKPAKNEGDRQRPSTRMEYDLLAFEKSPPGARQPVWVRTVRHAHHDTETDVPLPQRNEMIETVEYSDGFGRLLQTRARAEDVVFGEPVFGGQVLPPDQSDPEGDARDVLGQELPEDRRPRVVVSGWQTYDNKGRVVEKYEPFFSERWEYSPPTDAQLGQKATMFYDPRSQVIRTVNPDGSEQRVIYGVPGSISAPDLSDPGIFEPTPWEAYTYDANDNAGRTHPASSTSYQNHWNTPTSAVVDALGRTALTVERNGPDPETDRYVTRSDYDIRGNLLAITDPLGRPAFKHVYDLANRALRTEQLDAGLRRIVVNAAGNTVEQRDSKGALVLCAFDALNRQIRLWARDGAGQTPTPRERLIYGDGAGSGLSAAQAAGGNLLGKLYKHYDEAGLLTFEACDFKGNLVGKVRHVISDAAVLDLSQPLPAKWELLEATPYRTSSSYDALNRLKTIRYPQDVEGTDKRKELRLRYNRAGALKCVDLDGKPYVGRIAYNAKGQRTLVTYDNGVMTRHAYDPKTFRLLRMRTERYAKPGPVAKAPVQNFVSNSVLGASSAVPVRLTWAATTDSGGTVAAYDLQQSTDGGAYASVPLPTPAATALSLSLVAGRSYRFRVRARDSRGDWGEWAEGVSFKVAIYEEDDAGVSYPSGTWTRELVSGASGGFVKSAAEAGARARFSFTGSGVAWVATEADKRGKAEVWVDGEKAATVDLRSQRPLAGRVVFSKEWGTSGAHTIEVKRVGASRRPIDVDAFVVLGAGTVGIDVAATNVPTYRPAGTPLQDFAYTYDLAGNVLSIVDRTPGSGVKGNTEDALRFRDIDEDLARLLNEGDALIREFGYDPLYRLLSATGRECTDIPKPRPWPDDPRCGFGSGNHGTPNQDNAPNLTATYREEYSYDPTGNMVSLRHHNSGGPWTRHFGVGGLRPQMWAQEWPKHLETLEEWPDPPGNRLTHVGDNDATTAQTHFYDANGNLIRQNLDKHFEWDHGDRMRAYRTQVGESDPSVHAHYLYDSGGQRVKKLVRKGGQVEVTVYIDGVFEQQRVTKGNATQENNTLHVMDNQSRIALVRVGKPFPDDKSPAVKYHLGDHLGSSNVVIDDEGKWVNREEYTPYGETSFGSFALKRYRFTGKERDEESGLYYHGGRYYAPWLARWASCDPVGMVDGINLYVYVHSNPIKWVDYTGLAGQLPPEVTAEVSGVQALEAKYTKVDQVTNITPAKQINSPGVDAHLIVGKGKGAVNVIGDVKYSGQERPRNVSEVSSFENARRDSGLQLRENIINARKSGLIDKTTARTVYEDAKAGIVIEDVVVVGSNKGVSAGLKAKQVAVTTVDTFAHIVEKVEAYATRVSSKAEAFATRMRSGAKAIAPALLTMGWQIIREVNAEEEYYIRYKQNPTAEDIEFMESGGWKMSGHDTTGQPTWEYQPSWDRKLSDTVIKLLDVPNIVMRAREQESLRPDV